MTQPSAMQRNGMLCNGLLYLKDYMLYGIRYMSYVVEGYLLYIFIYDMLNVTVYVTC